MINRCKYFKKAVKVHIRFSKQGWELDRTTIFAQIDAFIQRCKDLIEVITEKVYFLNKLSESYNNFNLRYAIAKFILQTMKMAKRNNCQYSVVRKDLK